MLSSFTHPPSAEHKRRYFEKCRSPSTLFIFHTMEVNGCFQHSS